jgi:hypothetical protein
LPSKREPFWLNSNNYYAWPRVDRFDFANGASLSINDALTKLNVGEGAEILYGSPSNDLLERFRKTLRREDEPQTVQVVRQDEVDKL